MKGALFKRAPSLQIRLCKDGLSLAAPDQSRKPFPPNYTHAVPRLRNSDGQRYPNLESPTESSRVSRAW